MFKVATGVTPVRKEIFVLNEQKLYILIHKMYCSFKTFSGKVLVTRVLMIVMNIFREPVSAVDWETAGPDVLKSHVIEPLFNQTYPGKLPDAPDHFRFY